MARLFSFMYCLNAERQQPPTNSINAIGVLSTFKPDYVPGAFSFSIIFSILGLDMSTDNTVRITFSKRDALKPLVDTGNISLSSNELNKDAHSALIPEEYQGVDFTLDFRNVVFKENGVYVTTVYLNGDALGEQDIYVSGLNTNV